MKRLLVCALTTVSLTACVTNPEAEAIDEAAAMAAAAADEAAAQAAEEPAPGFEDMPAAPAPDKAEGDEPDAD